MDIDATTAVWILMGIELAMAALVYWIGYQAGRRAVEVNTTRSRGPDAAADRRCG